jgi:hypothetical protein
MGEIQVGSQFSQKIHEKGEGVGGEHLADHENGTPAAARRITSAVSAGGESQRRQGAILVKLLNFRVDSFCKIERASIHIVGFSELMTKYIKD